MNPDSKPPKKAVKLLNSIHNIHHGCNTIRLGSLEYYRNHPNEKIRDTMEGVGNYNIEYDKNGILMWNVKYQNHRTSNSLIFCSTMDFEYCGDKFDSSYDSKLYINDPFKFAELLAMQLAQQLKRNQYHNWNEDDIVSLAIDINPVHYAEKNFRLVDMLPPQIGQRICFIKPLSFQKEKELRFCFSVVRMPRNHSQQPQIISCVLDYLDVDITDIREDLLKITSLA